ncbi:MAG: ATP-binding cassette domain-containing protein [Pseudohongiellaceae bacterium]
MPPSVLTLTNVNKQFGDFRAVKDLSLSIPRGSVYGFLGPNGAGKTTSIRMSLGILAPDSGELSILDHPSALQVRSRIGYLPEEKGLYKKMRVWAIIAYFGMLKGLDKKTAKARSHELLEKYGLHEFAEARVEALSKGMGQKVQVLASVVHEPELVILDEPFSGLDPVNQQVLEKLIRDMADNGQTVIFSTHVMQHAERLCDHLLLITHGTKVFDGTVAQARALIPRRITLETPDEAGPLTSLEGVVNIVRDGSDTQRWQVQISEKANPQDILKKCFTEGIALSRFEYTEPSLHDVFVHLVKAEPATEEA